MADNPVVSIVIPFYNAEDTIRYCLDSVLVQSHSDFELILVNDGSTDNTERIMRDYAENDKRIRIFNQENQGQAAARNHGVQQAQGKYTVFVDGDDFVHPDYVKLLVQTIEKVGSNTLVTHSAYDVVSYEEACSGDYVWQETSVGYRHLDKNEALILLMHDVVTESPWAKIAPTSLWLSHPFPEGRLYEDLAVASRLFSSVFSVYALDTSTYAYVMRDGSTTHVVQEEKIIKQYNDYHKALSDFCAGIERLDIFRAPLAFRRCLSYARMYALLEKLPAENKWACEEKKKVRTSLRAYLPLALRDRQAPKTQLARFALLAQAPRTYHAVFETAKKHLSNRSVTDSVHPSQTLTREEIQAALLDLLLAFIDYCDSHGLHYSLAGGTMLGAIRHKGFIPWDDDIDVSMPRPDYEYLINHAEELHEKTGFVLAGYRGLSLDISPMVKMENPEVSILEIGTLPGNLYIDILPVDGLPFADEDIEKHYEQVTRLRDALSLLVTGRVSTSHWAVGLVKDYVIAPFNQAVPQLAIRLAKKLRDMTTRYKYDSATKVGIVSWGLYGAGEAMSKEDYENRTEVIFEGHTVQTLRGWNGYLAGLYGDYMQLPPEDKRETHGIIARRITVHS